jgi:hypothetical protein
LDPTYIYDRGAIGWDGGGLAPGDYSYHSTLAHEIGHNLGRQHAPCGGGANLDPEYRHPNGKLGAAGYDVATGTPLDPNVWSDIMSYCPPRWVSDYTFGAILDARRNEPVVLGLADPGALQDSLVVSGSLNGDGSATLDPAFEIQQEPDAPKGDCTLVCRDAADQILLEFPFTPAVVEDLPQAKERRTFALVLPMTPEMKTRLASLAVVAGGKVLAERRPSQGRALLAAPGAATAATPLPRDPVATLWRPGVVQLTWDASAHPKVVVKDAASGAIIGIGEDGALELVTEARELDLLLSDGVRSLQQKVVVR